MGRRYAAAVQDRFCDCPGELHGETPFLNGWQYPEQNRNMLSDGEDIRHRQADGKTGLPDQRKQLLTILLSTGSTRLNGAIRCPTGRAKGGRMTCWKTTLVQRDRARALRPELTEAEKRLWSVLQKRGAGGRFRRQAPIGPYIVDFLCQDGRLIVEVDAAGPADAPRMRTDLARTAFLQALGFRLMRFSSHDALFNLEAVVATLLTCLADRFAAMGCPDADLPAYASGGRLVGRFAPQNRATGEIDARIARRPFDPAHWPVEHSL